MRAGGRASSVVEVFEELRIGAEQHARVRRLQRALIGLHRAIEREEIRILAEGLGEDAVLLRIARTTDTLGLAGRLGLQHRHAAVGRGADAPGGLLALGADLGCLALTLGLHAAINGEAVRLGQIGPLDADIEDRDAEALAFGVHLLGDLLHQGVALIAHHRLEGRAAEHTPKRGFEEGAKPRPGAKFVTHRLIEQERVGDAPAGEGIDHQTLLIGCDYLLRRGIEIEQPLVEIDDVLDERDLVVEAGLGDETLGLAELEHERLLRLVDGEERQVGGYRCKTEQKQQKSEGGALHYCCPPSGVEPGAGVTGTRF